MRAHKLEVTIPDDRKLVIRLPDDFPPGPGEVLILATPRSTGRPEEAPRALVPHPVLEKIGFHEDPSLPLKAADGEKEEAASGAQEEPQEDQRGTGEGRADEK